MDESLSHITNALAHRSVAPPFVAGPSKSSSAGDKMKI